MARFRACCRLLAALSPALVALAAVPAAPMASAATRPGARTEAAPAGPPLLVEARVLWLESGLESGLDGGPGTDSGDDAVGLEVEAVHGGFSAGSVLAAAVPRGGTATALASRRALELARREDRVLQVVLNPGPRGSWRIADARVLRPVSAELAAPPPLIAPDPTPPPDAPLDDGSRLRLGAAASTPSYEQQVVELVNQERLANGNLPPLKQVDLLHSSSETHSSNMASRDFFAHCDLDTGDSPWDRMFDAGYFYASAAENIAAGYVTPQDVMTGWMNSSGHRSNILSTNRWEIGVGYVSPGSDSGNIRRDVDGNCAADSFGNGPYYRYWTQNFGRRNGVYPVVIEREAHSTASPSVALYVYGTGWAQEMRFSNDHATWSAWEPYTPNKTWTLAPGNGARTVWAQVRNGGATFESSDTIELDGDCSLTELHDGVLHGAQSFEDCEIHAGPALTVAGDLTLRADRTVLRSGFAIAEGGTLTVAPRI